MERKIGEIFEYNGEWYQVVECDSCGECSLRATECGGGTKSDLADEVFGECSKVRRSDSKHAIFKKLEKVGEPYSDYCPTGRIIYFQRYRCYQKPIIEGNIIWHWADDTLIDIDIEIKQKQEDMKEKNLNLKPFDLEAAKAGKPVCTRDGRKARIICFNAKNERNIIALVQDAEFEGEENVVSYYPNGYLYDNDFDTSADLMMLPEKKEGWVNVYQDCGQVKVGWKIFPTKEEAIENFKDEGRYITTTKIEWAE